MAESLHLASGGKILDTNSNELLEFAQTADAQNHIKITNKGTGSNPVIEAVGSDDTNVGLNLVGKGAGSLTFNTNLFTVSSSGDTVIAGTLNVTGATTLAGASLINAEASYNLLSLTQTLNDTTAYGNTETYTMVNLNLTETDASGWLYKNFIDLQNGGTSKFLVDTSGNTTITGTLDVTGVTTLTGALAAIGGIQVTSNTDTALSVTGIADIYGATLISYYGNLSSALQVYSNTATALSVIGIADIYGATNITGDTSITGATSISYNGNLSAALQVTSNTYTALSVIGTTKFGGYTYTWPAEGSGSGNEFLKISTVDNNSHTITLDWDTGGGVTTLDDLTDVVTSNGVIDFYNSIFISTNNAGDTLSNVTTGSSNNIIIGQGGVNTTSYALTTGSNNIVLGNYAFTSATTAGDNVVLGVTAGSSITTGTNNTLVGKSSGTQIFIVSQETGTLDANGNSTTVFTLESTQSGVDDYYNGLTITFTSGSNDGETRTISDYVGGSSQTVTVSSSFAFIPTSGDTYQINYGNLDANGNSTTVFTLESDKSSTDDFYNGCSITFTSGTNNGETQTISDYVGSSRTVTVSSAFSANPTLVDTYYIKSAALSTGDYNTLIGSNTYCTAAGDNQTSLGYQAGCTAANQVTLGNSSITALRCADTTIASLSDARDKTNVSDSTYGINFINSLRPVQYTWDRRNLQPGDSTSVLNGKTRVGFLAQELQDAMPNGENDVLDLVYEVDPNRLEAKYGNLIPILTKAIQDLSAANEALIARVTALENA